MRALDRGGALVLCLVGSAFGQHELWTLRGSPSAGMGYAVAGLGDATGDGVADFGVGAPFDDPQFNYGVALAYSGSNLQMLTGWGGGQGGALAGFSIAGPGDVDGDGRGDFLVGVPGEYGGGEVVLLSVRPALNLCSITTAVRGDWTGVGRVVAATGDLDADGRADFALAAIYRGVQSLWVVSGARAVGTNPPARGSLPPDDYTCAASVGDLDGDGTPDLAAASSRGVVTVVSGRTLAVLFTTPGERVAAAGDVDGDGVGDLLVTRGLGAAPVVQVVCGATGTVHATLVVPTPTPCLGYALAGGRDLDGDRVPDFLVGDPGGPGPGRVWAFSGASATPLYALSGERPSDAFGFALAMLGTVDADAAADFAVGAPGACPFGGLVCCNSGGGGWSDGYVRVVSGAALASYANTEVLSAAGGQQTMHFYADPRLAGKPYAVLGTTSGTAPGVTFLGVAVPLNPDAYTELVAHHAIADRLLHGAFGHLDDNGQARATLRLPAQVARGAVGMQLHHLFVVVDGLQVLAVGAPIPLRVVQ